MGRSSPVFVTGNIKDVGIHNAGSIAVEDSGVPSDFSSSSETFLLLPGMGDLRQSYRFLAPLLFEAGHRVLIADLRGQGESSSGFPSHTPLDVANDIIVILKYLAVGKPVIIVGNSLCGASILKVAATVPALVKATIGLAPVCRDMSQDFWFRPLTYILFAWPWGVPAWVSYYKTLYKKNVPEDMAEYEQALKTNLWGYGRIRAVAEFGRGSKQPCFEAIGNVKCPVLLIFGEKDPDFSNPLEEAHEVARFLTSTKTVKYEVVAGVGHYPHVEEPQQVHNMIMSFIKDL